MTITAELIDKCLSDIRVYIMNRTDKLVDELIEAKRITDESECLNLRETVPDDIVEQIFNPIEDDIDFAKNYFPPMYESVSSSSLSRYDHHDYDFRVKPISPAQPIGYAPKRGQRLSPEAERKEERDRDAAYSDFAALVELASKEYRQKQRQ